MKSELVEKIEFSRYKLKRKLNNIQIYARELLFGGSDRLSLRRGTVVVEKHYIAIRNRKLIGEYYSAKKGNRQAYIFGKIVTNEHGFIDWNITYSKWLKLLKKEQ